MTASQAHPGFKKWLDGVEQAAVDATQKKTDTLYYKTIDHVSEKTGTLSEKWKSLHNVDQILVGMSFIGAAMGGVNAFSYARNSVGHNEQGEATLRPSMVGLALLHTVLAVGSAVIGTTIMKNAHTRF